MFLAEEEMGEVCEPSPKSNALSEIGEDWIHKYFHFFVFKGLNKLFCC